MSLVSILLRHYVIKLQDPLERAGGYGFRGAAARSTGETGELQLSPRAARGPGPGRGRGRGARRARGRQTLPYRIGQQIHETVHDRVPTERAPKKTPLS